MDPSRFDRLARTLGRPTTRRATIVAALAAIAVRGATVAPDAAARTICRPTGAGCTRDAQCCTTICATGAGPRRERNRCAAPICLALNETGCRVPGKSCCADLECNGPASGICTPPF
jgi:hypothetical protein